MLPICRKLSFDTEIKVCCGKSALHSYRFYVWQRQICRCHVNIDYENICIFTKYSSKNLQFEITIHKFKQKSPHFYHRFFLSPCKTFPKGLTFLKHKLVHSTMQSFIFYCNIIAETVLIFPTYKIAKWETNISELVKWFHCVTAC